MATTVYVLCALTSTACALLLLRAYAQSRVRLLLWSGLCFSFLALNNVLLFIDMRVLPEVDLTILRRIPVVLGLSIMIFGFIWDQRSTS